MCNHSRILELRNITALIHQKGHLTGGVNLSNKYDQIRYCSNPVCEKVFEVNFISIKPKVRNSNEIRNY